MSLRHDRGSAPQVQLHLIRQVTQFLPEQLTQTSATYLEVHGLDIPLPMPEINAALPTNLVRWPFLVITPDRNGLAVEATEDFRGDVGNNNRPGLGMYGTAFSAGLVCQNPHRIGPYSPEAVTALQCGNILWALEKVLTRQEFLQSLLPFGIRRFEMGGTEFLSFRRQTEEEEIPFSEEGLLRFTVFAG